jgi:hypothetical protein
MYHRQLIRRTLAVLTLALLAISATHAPWLFSPVSAQTAAGTIAYVRADTGDEIRLIEPDGRNDRRLWAHGLADPHQVYGIYTMAWRPDARELAFASTHENWCSINYSDVFAIRADGNGYRRITQAPSCGALANYPKGTVQVPVKNVSFYGSSFTGFVYFQGAPSIQPVSLPAGASTVVTFHNVADFGADVFQIAAFIDGAHREYSVGTAVDVQAGKPVTTGGLSVIPPSNMGLEPRSPTWRSNGASLGYVYGYGSLYGITANPRPLEFGRHVINPNTTMGIVEYMAYGPTAATANQILFQGNGDDGIGIYRATEGDTTIGQPLVTSGFELIRGLAWLPDGSGFVYAVEEYENYEVARANIFEYTFASKQVKRLTNFANRYAGQLSVSPDSKQIVFDLSTAKDGTGTTDVWIMNRDGSGQRLLVSNGYAPSWSPRALPAPLSPRVYLPLSQR